MLNVVMLSVHAQCCGAVLQPILIFANNTTCQIVNALMHCYQNRLAYFVTGVSYSRKLFIKLARDWPFSKDT